MCHTERTISAVISSAVCLALAASAMAVNIDYVTVGDSGNADDTHGAGYGGVGYVYRIGTYEVTAGQYCEFLNAVAADDTYGLYSTEMWSHASGCKIQRAGLSEGYSYNIPDPNRVNRPVNFVSFWDACRFSNWLHNGQPTGAQDLTTTEAGAYALNGYTGGDGSWIARDPDARAWVPSEDEWYKAAYYKGGGLNAGYWDYPTRSDTVPTAEAPPGTDPVNGSANYVVGVQLVDPIYSTTEVGAYDWKPSDSVYGTFDQAGNLREWNEAIVSHTSWRGVRGGAWNDYDYMLCASRRDENAPTAERHYVGFRVAEVPEPGSLALLAAGGLALLARRRRGTAPPAARASGG